MAKRCGTRNGNCPAPRANWWKQSLGVDWFNHNTSGGVDPSPFPKKDNLLVIIWGQSNEATIDDAGQQETGSVPFADLPTYLQTAPANVLYLQKGGGGTLTLTQWSVPAGLEWGWRNQFLHIVATAYDEVMMASESLGGSNILPGGGGLFPRADLKAVVAKAITEANARWGSGNYNVVYVCGIGESNAANAADADAWLPAMVEFQDNDLRANYVDAPVVIIKKGRYQVIDFPYIVSNLWASQDAYVALDPENNFIVSGDIPNGGGGWELQDVVTDDFSHYNVRGAISMGNAVAEKVLYLFGGSKSDSTKPVLQSAVIESGNPNKIVYTFSKALNTVMVPFWKDITVNSSRKATALAASGSTITVTFSENFYSGETVTSSYIKKQYYENAICDELGNEADAFSNIAVTNNSATATPTYTLRYQSDFSAGVDSWGGLSGGVPASVDGIGGLDDVLEMGSTDTTPIITRSTVFANATDLHRIRLKVYVPVNLDSANPSRDYSLKITGSAGGLIGNDFYQYIRRNVLGGQWVDLEFTVVPSGSGAMRFDDTCTIGDKVWFRDIVVHRLT